MLILIVGGLAVPALMRAYRGEPLRTAVRELAAAHRLARGLACLRATPMELRLDPSGRRIEVHGSPMVPPSQSAEAPPDAESPRDAIPGDGASPVRAEVVRVWAEEVRLIRVEINGEPQEAPESVTLSYAPDGGMPEWRVWFEDRHGERAQVWVDPYTGRVEIAYERP